MSTDTSNTAEATGTISEAAAAFEAMLGADGGQPEAPKKAPEQEAEADEAEALVATSEEEDADPAIESEEGSEEEADDQADEPEEQLELPLDALVTVKIGDTTEQVSLEEAIKGYQRQSDYQRKTQALAKERQVFIQTEVQAVRQERAQYAALLNNLDTQLREAAPKEPDWDRLRMENPMEFAVQREEWRMLQDKQHAVRAEQARLQQLRAREEQENIQQHIANEGQRLVEALPVLKDEKQRVQVQKQLREYGKQLGYTDDELSQAYDHRAVLALYKAMQFDALRAKKPVAQRPVVKASKPIAPTARTLAAGSANTPSRQVTELTRAKQRLAKTGSVRDAASIFEQLL